MSRRPIAWLIFFGFLALVSMVGIFSVQNLVLHYATWSIWLVLSVCFVWRYARTGSSAERLRLIDTRGVNLLPLPLRRWLFDE